MALDIPNHPSPYTVYSAAGINYISLATGSVLGTQNVGAADTGVDHYVDIILNATALSLLDAAQES